MGEIVNLRRHRRRQQRAAEDQAAADNRARFGRTRGDRALDELQAGQREAVLDGARLDRPPEPPATEG